MRSPAPLEPSPATSEFWLSVLMPTCNGARYVATALESVVAAGRTDVEVIVVDDGSTDETLSIVESFAQRLTLRVIPPERTGNWAANTNRALAHARGEYIGCLHQDDYWLAGRLQRVRAAIECHGDAALVLHPSRFVDVAGRELGTWGCPLPARGGLLSAELVTARLLVQNFLSMPAPLFRRTAVEQVGGFDEDLWYTADWDLWLKLAALGPSLYLPEALACFRIHPQSQTASRSGDTVEFRRQMEAVLQRHLPRWQQAHPHGGRRLARVAQFSIDVNAALAAAAHGQGPSIAPLAWRGLRLGPLGWHQYWRDSRIGERVRARLRARAVAPGDQGQLLDRADKAKSPAPAAAPPGSR